ncbi:translocator protein [Rosa sericea]
MDSQNLKQRRVADDPNTTTSTAATMNKNNYPSKRDMRMKMAKRGLRSLAVAVSLPVALHLITIYLGSTDSYRTTSKPFWFPPLWGLRLTCLASSFLMGLSAWLVWAEGGFHKNPVAFPVYLSQLVLSLAWDPIVFGAGAPWVGFVVCMGMFGALVGCSKVFQDVNPTAGDLMKPCLAWVAFLAVVNLKLVYL